MKYLLTLLLLPVYLFGDLDQNYIYDRFAINSIEYDAIDRNYYVSILDNVHKIEYYYQLTDKENTLKSITSDIFDIMIWNLPKSVYYLKDEEIKDMEEIDFDDQK